MNVDDAESVEVGQIYLVNVVKAGKGSAFAGATLPVLGVEAHDDSEYGIFYGMHLHVDWRFIPPAVYEDTLMAASEAFGGVDPHTPNLDLASVILESGIVGKQRRAMICHRPHSRWAVGPEWLPRLEQAYKDKRVVNNACPHRGVSLVGAPEDSDGNRICPGHGLAWDKSGALVPRASKQQEDN